MFEAEVIEYRPNETERLVAEPVLQRDARKASIRVLAKEAGVSENTVKAVRNRKRLRRDTVDKLKTAISVLLNERWREA